MSSESEKSDEKDLQSEWKVVSTALFVKNFGELFKLPEIEIETLEEGLLNQSKYGIHVVKNLVVALVKGFNPTRRVKSDNYETFLKKKVAAIWAAEARKEENPLKENTSFEDIAAISKLEIIDSLCYHLLHETGIDKSKMNTDLLRVQPLGCDDEGNEYWYFYGTRLYKQEASKDKKIKDWEEEWNTQKSTSLVKRGRGRPRKTKPRKSDGESDESEESLTDKGKYHVSDLGEKSRWSVVCNTLNDWIEFTEKFKDSKSKCERTLFRTLTNDFLPVMNEAYQAKEMKLQQKLRELIPKPTFTKMETRPRRTKSTSDIHRDEDVDKVSSREQRLEERNRRLNESAENGSRRRSRSRISYDESYDDFDDESSKRSRKRSSFIENDEEYFVNASSKRLRNRLSYLENGEGTKSKRRESIEAKANEVLKEYASVTSSSSNNKSQILRVLTQLKLDKNSYPFHYQVDRNEFPDYLDIVSEPMDLARIDRKLRLNIYKTAAEVDEDFKLMVENCELYFGVDSERSKMGRQTWRLFRRLMIELAASPKQNEDSAVPDGTVGNENPNREKRAAKIDSEGSERAKKKRKFINTEALDILSREAELAVERSQSMDEEHFRNFTQKGKKLTQFSDLIVEPIHNHPSDLIQKFMSDSSNQSTDDSNSNDFSSTGNQNSDNLSSTNQCLRENKEANDFNESNEENSNSSQSMDKIDPKDFNILSSDNEANLEILCENDMYPPSISNCLPTDFHANRDKKSGGDDLNNLAGSCDDSNGNNLVSNCGDSNLNSSLSSNSFESYHSPNSSSSGSSPKDSANGSPQHTENNNTYLNGFEYVNFTHENEANGSSTVDASCLGLASANVYKKHQHEKGPNTSVADNFSEASQFYNGNQNSYDDFGKPSSRTQVFPKNQPKIRSSSSNDQLIEELFPRPEISRGKPNSPHLAFQGMQAPIVDLESSKSPPAYSYSSHQLIQGQIDSQSSKTIYQPSALSSEQAVQHKTQNLKHSETQLRCSPPFLAVEKTQSEGNIETQPNCSPVFTPNGEVDDLEHSRSNNLTLLQRERLPEPEVSHHSDRSNHRSSPTVSLSQEMQGQISSNDRANSPTYNMQQEVQAHLSVIQEHSKNLSGQFGFLPSQEIQGSEMASSFPPAASKDQDSAGTQQNAQKHSHHPSHDETQKQKPVKSQVKPSNISHPNKPAPDSMKFNSQQEVANGENNRNKPMISASLSADHQLKNKNNSTYWDQSYTGSQPRYSPTLSAHLEVNHQQPPAVNQPRYSPTFSANQEMNHQQPAVNQPRYSPTFSGNQEMNHQQPAVNQPRYSPTFSANQEMNHQQPAVNQPRYSSSFSANQEINHQQPAVNQPRYSPTFSANQEMNHQQPAVNQPRYSPISPHQETNHQQSAVNRPRYSPTASANQEMSKQQPAKEQPRYSPILPVHQDMNNQQPSNNQRRFSPNLSPQEAMNQHQPVENQLGCPPSAFTQQTSNKKSAKVQGSSAFLKPHIVAEQDPMGVQSSYLPAFVPELAKNSVQHMQNQVPVEAPPFDFDNIFANSFTSANATAQVEEPPFTVNSVMQIQPQVSTSHFSQSHPTKPIFPTMKLRLPPSTGELIVVPGDPSSMTFHLLAKPLSDPSQPIQSSVKIHANNQMRNQDYQENSTNETARSKNPSKQDTVPAPRKQISPIQDLEQLASNPRKSSNSPSSRKIKNYSNVSNSSRSVEQSLKSPPAITNDFSVIKPNAVLVRPLESSTNSMHAKNNSSFQQSAFAQQAAGPRTVIFPRGNQMTNVLGSSPVSTNSLSAMSMDVNNGQRHIIPNTMPNTVMQNGSGQYMFVPSKDILQSNVDQSSKMKNSESPPQFYASNMMQGFPFQSGQMNSIQMLPQVHLPYMNPYYIVANPSAFPNASRYPVMNMQPIPFQNR